MKVAVIGGGASGLVAAIEIARRGFDVTILERNASCGKKLLMTGNGRCNYWNEDQNLEHYHSKDLELLENIMTKENQRKVFAFFESIGILPRIKNGYYYPYSNQATSIKSALLKELERSGGRRIENFYVEEIGKRERQFIINPKRQSLVFDRVILATGSRACPKTGSDGNGYLLAQSFGHTIVPVLPSLVQLKAEDIHFKEWDGVRVDGKISLYVDDLLFKEESGEIQFTDYGISGICTFNLSGFVSKALANQQKVFVKINFCPFLNTIDQFLSWFSKRCDGLKMESIEDLLEGFLNYKLIHGILKKMHLSRETKWNDLSLSQKKDLARHLISFEISIGGTNSFEKAQVCSGGVPLSEIHIETMESKKVQGLYLIGELLDVDGDCGGYNLGFAWISGVLAGKGVTGK